MAVTKIRKMSSWALIIVVVLTVGVLGLFYLGGDNPPLDGKSWTPKNTDILLYWLYIAFGVTVGATLLFAIAQFITNAREDFKKALVGLGIIAAFVALAFITYTMGNGEPMAELDNPTTGAYNTAGWLKATDMFLYSLYVMFGITLLCSIAGSIKNSFSR